MLYKTHLMCFEQSYIAFFFGLAGLKSDIPRLLASQIGHSGCMRKPTHPIGVCLAHTLHKHICKRIYLGPLWLSPTFTYLSKCK